MSTLSDLDNFLDSEEANQGVRGGKARHLISQIPGDEDEAYQYFSKIVIPQKQNGENATAEISSFSEDGKDFIADDEEEAQAIRSYRAMIMLKEDISIQECPSILIKNPDQAGLLAKELFVGLSISNRKRYSTLHIRELLDALLEVYPEKVMAAASAGGKKGIQEHFGPLLSNDQTLSVLTHLVCYGCTGRRGIASAEKSAQHTANQYHQNIRNKNKIGIGQRKKFVRACMDFQLLDRLAKAITTTIAATEMELGEEVCEALLVMIELIGYPPEDILSQQQIQRNDNNRKDEIVVGEDILLSPLASNDWWAGLIDTLCQPACTPQQRLAISRTCMQVFSLATGSSSRVCKSHAPATDATEEIAEKVIEEKEEKLSNRLIEWGLTDKIHIALVTQLPLLIKALDLPNHDILNYEATYATTPDNKAATLYCDVPMIRHPGRYQTVPLGSWRLQLLALLKEIIVYRKANSDQPSQAIEAIMELPLPREFNKATKTENERESQEDNTQIIYNPWPALCSYIWAYPNNDFYGIIFYEMLRSVVLMNYEPTLRLILQKSKFLSKAVKSATNFHKQFSGVLLDCLNLLRLRALSLSPSQFLPQYLNSHDGWKEHVDQLVHMTMNQQTPIKDEGKAVEIGLGSNYAKQLGLTGVTEYDGTTSSTSLLNTSGDANQTNRGEKLGKKRKKNKKKKKK